VSTNASVPKLAWLNSDGTKASTAFPDPTVQPPQVPAYIDGLQCQTTNGQAGVLPAPYGVLSNNANLSTGTIKVNTSPQNAVLPTPTPEFDIVIGTERMRVKAIQGSTWTVDRQTGLTTPSTHPAGAKVMSTPLPLLPAGVPAPYIEGKQAQMCVVGSPTPVTPATNPPMWSTTIIDLSDGWVRIGGF
jgi:hypothetical protein